MKSKIHLDFFFVNKINNEIKILLAIKFNFSRNLLTVSDILNRLHTDKVDDCCLFYYQNNDYNVCMMNDE